MGAPEDHAAQSEQEKSLARTIATDHQHTQANQHWDQKPRGKLVRIQHKVTGPLEPNTNMAVAHPEIEFRKIDQPANHAPQKISTLAKGRLLNHTFSGSSPVIWDTEANKEWRRLV